MSCRVGQYVYCGMNFYGSKKTVSVSSSSLPNGSEQHQSNGGSVSSMSGLVGGKVRSPGGKAGGGASSPAGGPGRGTRGK